ncbi:uncharacterized protein TRIADDRAFT_53642 [Trichoplax adhaerens]|uniref:Cleavage and polyadenylation specificity factor subunit 4 n=1 Tax=Trichoplax adhaerens TaxID=10228 RepID=B3RPS1_TRIAD|nr:hypothetical protein TRIADDRAFT_53642 [Trichoplax adhaerens]EDV27689.1 hypothetical protein TRIADDRAFT_53642 [Trichoplax adhaerens]|eukprot:XP_002109523.1 hypothetical protein TRIADDRAFT_53642 [Trichoplax adhaerens]
MESIIANVDNIKFTIEFELDDQIGTQQLPFPGMDKSGAAVCTYFAESQCVKGSMCPFRHTKGDKTVVCKHWLRGLCKKGDQCEFLHEYDMTKMPECYFYSKFGECSNKECQYLHINPESKIKDCPWYDRGFCKHGPACRHRHVRRVACLNYLNGFCPEGSNCKHVHLRFELPTREIDIHSESKRKPSVVVCHNCGEYGHKASACPNQLISIQKENSLTNDNGNSIGISHDQNQQQQKRPMDQVICFKDSSSLRFIYR